MKLTLRQASACLKKYGRGYGFSDIRDAINAAIQDLSGMSGWECLRKTLRISSAGPGFSLPQGCAGLVRACINGHPAHVRGPDFRFIHSGPGDSLRLPPAGFSFIHNILDDGESPVYYHPVTEFRVFASSDGVNQPPLTLVGLDTSGSVVTYKVPMTPEATDLGAVAVGGPVFQVVQSVSIDPCADQYITLYAEDIYGDRYPIARYHPEVKAPVFRRYTIPEVPPGAPVELLVETRIDPLPLISDDDVLPFDTVRPVEWMIIADWKLAAGEIDAAQKYQNLAAQWLKAREVTNDTTQASLVINNVFEGSLGEVSAETWNI